MHQLEIQFFWPLTEQIPLDLDYEGCAIEQKLPTMSTWYTNGALTSTHVNWPVTVLKLTEDAVTFTYKEEPPWYRKLMLKIIGFNWEKR